MAERLGSAVDAGHHASGAAQSCKDANGHNCTAIQFLEAGTATVVTAKGSTVGPFPVVAGMRLDLRCSSITASNDFLILWN